MFLFVHVLTLKNPGQIICAPFYSAIDNNIPCTFLTYYFVSIIRFFLSFGVVRGEFIAQSKFNFGLNNIPLPCDI